MSILTERERVGHAIAPSADLYNGDPSSDVFNLKHYGHITFVVIHGAGATGTATFTVEECTAADGTGATAIPYRYRVGTSTGALSALTSVAATGYTIVAGSNQTVAIELDAAELSDDSPYVRLTATEGVDSPVAGCVLAILSEPRYAGATLDPAIT